MTSTFVPTGKELPFANGRFLLVHRFGSGSFGDIFEGYDNLTSRRVAVKLEKKKVPFPLLPYEGKVYRILHQPRSIRAGGGVDFGISTGSSSNHHNHNAATLCKEAAPLHALAGQASSSATTTAAAAATSRTQQPHDRAAVGVPLLYHVSAEGDYNVLVMELCGPSLEELFNYCHRRFSLKTVLMLADQMLARMEFFHDKGFVHRDIKPENFVMGDADKAHIVYIIDFGLSKLFWYVSKNAHMPFAEGKSLTGTARYCSVNTHRGYEQSRRDDLESIGYLFIYFLRSSLPWQGIQARDQAAKTSKIGEKKMSTSLEQLCKGLPCEFLRYIEYCRKLGFQERPDYDYLRGMFRSLGRRCGAARPCPRYAGGVDGGGSSPSDATARTSAQHLSTSQWCSANGKNYNNNSSSNNTYYDYYNNYYANNNNNSGSSGGNHAEYGDSPVGGDALTGKTAPRHSARDFTSPTTAATAAATTAAAVATANSGVQILHAGGGGGSNDGGVNDATATTAGAVMLTAGDRSGGSNNNNSHGATSARAGQVMLSTSRTGGSSAAENYSELAHEGEHDGVGFYDWCFDWFDKRIGEVDAARLRMTADHSGGACGGGGGNGGGNGGGGGATRRSGAGSSRGHFATAVASLRQREHA